MPKREINILVVVDCDAVLNDGAVSSHVYMVDDQGRLSRSQGTSSLTTVCHPGDTLNFRIAGIRPVDDPQLVKFVCRNEKPICIPTYDPEKMVWSGYVTGTGTQAYDWVIDIGGTEFRWDPYIESRNP